ncbi:MAG: hypothetical protein DRJ64_07100 [Thermoprotei archaeon]|nr:MAG: hypothetical protein DRJ64_07100 [Thermoprotei archaeon]
MRYRIEKIVEKVPIINNEISMLDAIRVFTEKHIPILVLKDTYITIDRILEMLLHHRENLCDVLLSDVSPYGVKLNAFMKRTSFRNIIMKVSTLSGKYAIVKSDKASILGAITPRSLFSYFKKYLTLNDMRYFLYRNIGNRITPNTSIIGVIKRMLRNKSIFSAVLFRGKFKGVISSYDILSLILEKDTLEKIMEEKYGYYYETSVSYLGYSYDSVIDSKMINTSRLRSILSKYSNVAVVSNESLECFIDDYKLIEYTKKKLVFRWYDRL